MLAPLDRFEQKRFTLSPDFPVGRERRFEVRKDSTGDRNQVPLLRKLEKIGQGRRMHDGRFAENSSLRAGRSYTVRRQRRQTESEVWKHTATP